MHLSITVFKQGKVLSFQYSDKEKLKLIFENTWLEIFMVLSEQRQQKTIKVYYFQVLT